MEDKSVFVYHAVAWLSKCFIDCAHVVLDVWLLVPEHSKESVYLVFIELNLITPVIMIFKLSEVLDPTRCAYNQFNVGEKQVMYRLQEL